MEHLGKTEENHLYYHQGDKLEGVFLAVSLFQKEISFKFPFRPSLILAESQKSLPSRNNCRGKVSLRKDCLFSFKVNFWVCFFPAFRNGWAGYFFFSPRNITDDGLQQIFFICKGTKGLCRMKGRATNRIYVRGLLYLLRSLDEISRDFHIFLHFSSLWVSVYTTG